MSEPSDGIQRRATIYARLNYIYTLIPEQLRCDPYVDAVAQLHVSRADFSVEACLADMVRQLSKARAEIQAEFVAHLNATAPPGGLRYIVPGAPDGGTR